MERPGRPPDHAPHLCKTAQRVDGESRAWKASLLCTVAEHLDVRKRPPTLWGMVRATARVPTPLHTTPALTMKTKEASPARYHCKGGGGVERGGDPCGRPAGGKVSWRLRPLDFYIRGGNTSVRSQMVK